MVLLFISNIGLIMTYHMFWHNIIFKDCESGGSLEKNINSESIININSGSKSPLQTIYNCIAVVLRMACNFLLIKMVTSLIFGFCIAIRIDKILYQIL